MNVYFLIAGVISVAGGLAHGWLGDGYTVRGLCPEHLASPQFTGDQNKRFIRWFWHVGTAVLLSTGAVLVLEGLARGTVHRHLLLYVASLWLATTGVFFAVTLPRPTQTLKLVPGLVGLPVNALIIAGLFA